MTFLGSAFGIYNAITTYSAAGMTTGLTQEAMENAKDQIDEQAQDEKSAEIVNKIMDSVSNDLSEEKVRNGALASGIANILTLIGAVLMWGLNKKGFFIYIAGTLVAIIAPLVIYDGFLGFIGSGMIAFVGIIFCVLYFLNIKYMA
jgi:phage-related protein